MLGCDCLWLNTQKDKLVLPSMPQICILLCACACMFSTYPASSLHPSISTQVEKHPRQFHHSILTPGKYPLCHPHSKKNSLIRSTEIKTFQTGSRRSMIKKLTPTPDHSTHSISESLIMETKRQANYIPIP